MFFASTLYSATDKADELASVVQIDRENVQVILGNILSVEGIISDELVSNSKHTNFFDLKFGKSSDKENIWIELTIPQELSDKEFLMISLPVVPIEIYTSEKIFSNFQEMLLFGNLSGRSQYYLTLDLTEEAYKNLDKLYIRFAYMDFRGIRSLEGSLIGDKENAVEIAKKRIRFIQIADNIFFFIGSLLIIVGFISLIIFFIRKPVREYFFLSFSLLAFVSGFFHWMLSPFTNFMVMNHTLRFHFIGLFYLTLYYLLLVFINQLFKYRNKIVHAFLLSFGLSFLLVIFRVIHPESMQYIFTFYICVLYIYTLIRIIIDNRFKTGNKILLGLGFSIFLFLFILQFLHILDRYHLVFSPFGLGIAILSGIFSYFIIQHYQISMRELEEKKMKLIKLQQDQLQSQLNALKNQIDPHFLFNNFGTLISLIEIDATLAINFVEELSSVYRYILQIRDKELITISEELDFTQSYIYLLKQRFRDYLIINIDLDLSVVTGYLVPMSLQLLVENACKHNIISKEMPLYVTIKNIGKEQIIVTNNNQPKRLLETSHKIGLENLRKRFSFFTNRSPEIIKTEHEFKVILPVIKEVL